MEYKIKAGVLQAVLDYLNVKPFGEVVALINAIKQSEPIVETEEIKQPVITETPKKK